MTLADTAPVAEPRASLRERKKLATRRSLRRHALDLVAQRGFEHAAGTKSLRRIGQNFRTAIAANSDYSDHGPSRSRNPALYSVKFSRTLRLEHCDEMAQLIFDIAGCRNGVGNLLSQ